MAGKRHIPYLLILLAVVGLDQLTKGLIVRHFSLGQSLAVIPDLFSLTYIKNTGVAFGLFARGNDLTRLLLLMVPCLVTLGLALFYFRLSSDQRRGRLAVSLILGGAISNLLDRFRLGYVVDFLDFHWKFEAHYPAFNAADAFICVGVLLLFLATRAQEKKAGVASV